MNERQKVRAGELLLDQPLWRFSLEIYAREGVGAECLSLQEAFGADVNILLYCVWEGSRGVRLADADLDTVVSATEKWHVDVVRPLRSARQAIKVFGMAQTEAFRNKVKKLELEAEQIEQSILYAKAQSTLPQTSDVDHRATISDNINLYLSAMGCGDDAVVWAPKIIAAACSMAS